MVLYLGRVVELAPTRARFMPIRAIPIPGRCSRRCLRPIRSAERARKRELLTGDLPSPLDPRAQLTFLKSRLDKPDYRPKLEQVSCPATLWPNMTNRRLRDVL